MTGHGIAGGEARAEAVIRSVLAHMEVMWCRVMVMAVVLRGGGGGVA